MGFHERRMKHGDGLSTNLRLLIDGDLLRLDSLHVDTLLSSVNGEPARRAGVSLSALRSHSTPVMKCNNRSCIDRSKLQQNII